MDEIIRGWFNKYSPGLMCVGRKPHPYGNERHMILCGLTSILWGAHIVEGKYRSSQIGEKQNQELGNMVGLMLRMFKPIVGSVKAVVFDSGFFVAKGFFI